MLGKCFIYQFRLITSIEGVNENIEMFENIVCELMMSTEEMG
jgi:hypothetical protein